MPRFVKEGYAVFARKYELDPRTDEVMIDEKTGKPIPYYGDFDFIGIKLDAPQWVHKEYEEWLSFPK